MRDITDFLILLVMAFLMFGIPISFINLTRIEMDMNNGLGMDADH